jgi:hypothetical protein
MTTTTLTTGATMRHAPSAAGRILNVAKLHLTNTLPIMVLPLMILGFIFLVNYLIWLLIFAVADAEGARSASDGIQYSGASMFIFVYMLVVAVQAVNLTFPFAQGYSVTRRDFYLGSALVFVFLSAYYATIMTVMAFIERATNGWGFGGSMFDVIYFRTENALLQFVLFFLLFLFFFFIGAAVASVYVRWKTNGMLVFFAALTLVLLGLAALVTLTDNWLAVWNWLLGAGALGVVVWSLVPTALAAITGFFVLRRATPRN